MSMSGAEDAAEYIRNIARQVADDTFVAFKEYLVSDIIPKLPTHDAIVKEVVASLNVKADQALQELGARMGQIESVVKQVGVHVPGTQPLHAPPGGAAPTMLQGTLAIPGTNKSFEIGPWAMLADYLLGMMTKWQEARIAMIDPLALALKIRETNPIKAAIAGQILYQDPLAAHLPGIMAQVGSQAYVQGLRSRYTAEHPELLMNPPGGGQWPGNPASATPYGGYPGWYGGPSVPQTGPQNVPQQPSGAPNPGAATMSGSRSRPAQQENGQDTVRAPRLLNTKGPPRLQGNFR